jgi:hypothetical protein
LFVVVLVGITKVLSPENTSRNSWTGLKMYMHISDEVQNGLVLILRLKDQRAF